MKPHRIFAASLLLLAISGVAHAGDAAIGIGEKLTPPDLEGVFAIPPDGAGLPAGQGSVSQGEAVYASQCAACHGDKLQGVKALGAPALIGGRGTLTTKPLKTVESYWPYATTLFDYIHRAMPFTAPQSLTPDQVYAVTAYVLRLNDIVPDGTVLDASTLPKVRMPNREGFTSVYQPPR